MFVVCVTSWVKPEHAEAYRAACEANAKSTRREPGNLRFDLLRGLDDPNQFFFYEVYRAQEDFEAHHKTAHYHRWRETVEPWMAKPRLGLKHESLFPDDERGRWSAG